MTAANDNRAGLLSLALRVTTAWAILGGVVLLAVILVNLGSVIGVTLDEIIKAFGAAPVFGAVPGDFELTEMGVAIAAFAFLPYCQAAGLNVTADIFTSRASPFWLAVFNFLASLVALAFAALLVWRMSLGAMDQAEYDYTTHILQLPTWWGYAAAVASLCLLVFAAFATLVDAAGRLKGR